MFLLPFGYTTMNTWVERKGGRASCSRDEEKKVGGRGRGDLMRGGGEKRDGVLNPTKPIMGVVVEATAYTGSP